MMHLYIQTTHHHILAPPLFILFQNSGWALTFNDCPPQLTVPSSLGQNPPPHPAQQADSSTSIAAAHPTPVRWVDTDPNTFSPMHTRFRKRLKQREEPISSSHPGDEEAAQAQLSVNGSMVEAAGPIGPILVHRPWANSDVASAAELSPDRPYQGRNYVRSLRFSERSSDPLEQNKKPSCKEIQDQRFPED